MHFKKNKSLKNLAMLIEEQMREELTLAKAEYVKIYMVRS
jgi:hypothetical protein